MSREIYARNMVNKLIYRRLAGNFATKKRVIRVAETMAVEIARRFGKTPVQWQQKHIIWFLDVHILQLTDGTRRNYKTSIKRILNALEKEHWEWILNKLK